MKTSIISISTLLITLFLFVNISNAQGIDVPQKVKAAFEKLYPDAKDVQWYTTPESNYEGRFKYHNRDMSVQINNEGKLVIKAVYLKPSALPKAIRTYLKKNAPGTAFDYYALVTNAKNVKHYQAGSKDTVLFFDTKGKLTKAEVNSYKDHGTIKLDGD